MGIEGWRRKAQDRGQWRRTAQEAKAVAPSDDDDDVLYSMDKKHNQDKKVQINYRE